MRFSLTKKIAIPYIFIVILMIITGTYSIFELDKVDENIQLLHNESRKGKSLGEFRSDVTSLLLVVNDYLITGDKQYYDDYNRLKVNIREEIKNLEEVLTEPEERKLLSDIENNLDSIKLAIPKLISVSERNVVDSVDLLIDKLENDFDNKINKDVAKLGKLIQDRFDYSYNRVRKEREKAFILSTIIITISILIAISIIIFSMKYISRPILKLVKMAQRIAARDFDVEMKSEGKDEIGMLIIAFNAMVDEISKRYEELENFSYIAAHDLKSPLAAIVGSAEVILDELEGKIDPDDEELLRNIIASGNNMTALIGDLLEFATAGKVEFAKEPVAVNGLLDEVKMELDYTIKQSHVKLTIQNNLPVIICDPARFQQVWENLIGNSIKYNDKPEPEIEIGINENYEDKTKYCFFIKDNGIGIDESYFAKIFNPFQRATADKKYKGTGIGLAIVKRIIEFHNGEIWVESEQGKGTTFFFTIPKQLIL